MFVPHVNVHGNDWTSNKRVTHCPASVNLLVMASSFSFEGAWQPKFSAVPFLRTHLLNTVHDSIFCAHFSIGSRGFAAIEIYTMHYC